MIKAPYQKSLIKQILKEGEKIYPISEEADKKCLDSNKIDNWAKAFYNIKDGIFKKRYIQIMSRTENNKFFEALNYEYGLNDYPLDLNKAYRTYKMAAETTNDTLSMFKLYRIYKKEYEKFNLSRNTVLEKYYLYKCCAYLTSQELTGGYYLKKRFNIIDELLTQLNNEDPNFELFEKLFKHLKSNSRIYNLDINEIILVEAVVKYISCEEDDEKEKSKILLNNLALKKNFEAMYKLICLSDYKSEHLKKMEFLYRNNYYRSYLDYALFLMKIDKKFEALKVIRIAVKNGYYTFILHYIDIFFEIKDFGDIMNNSENRNEFLFIIGCLIDYLIADGVYSFYDIIYIRHICLKYFNFQKEFNEYFFNYTKEIVNFLIKITEGSEEENKSKIKEYYINSNYFCELYFVCGILYYYGIEDILEKNYIKSLEKITVAITNSNDKNYKRFCYTYVLKIKEQLLKINNLQNSLNEANIKEEDLIDSKNKLFKMYFEGIIDAKIDNLSSSFFYYLSKLYKKKIGNKGDSLMEYIFMNRAANTQEVGIGSNSFIVYYRRYKAKLKIIQLNKDDYYEKLKTVKGYMNEEGYGEDGSICPICYENKKSTICLPCKHFFCEDCLKKMIKESRKCPICRTIIVMTFNVQTKKENLLLSDK